MRQFTPQTNTCNQTKMTELPNKWYVEVNEANKIILTEWVKRQPDFKTEYLPIRKFIVSNKREGSYQFWGFEEGIPYNKITFEQFERLVLKKDKKIIGYKAPVDLFGGAIKKGSTYTIRENERHFNYCDPPQGKSAAFVMPKEIVQTWEAVYEQDEFKGGNREIVSVKLCSGMEITMKQVAEIVEFFHKN